MSQWIWKFGEFENYHSLLLHSSRQNYGYIEPVVWKQYPCEPVVVFKKEVTTAGGEIRISACGDFTVTVGYIWEDSWESHPCWGQKVITLKAGHAVITVRVSNLQTFPCLYVEGAVETDGTWICDDLTSHWEAVGTNEFFCEPNRSPEVFPFARERLDYIHKEPVNGGVLFDFGKETYAAVALSGLTQPKVTVCYGESREEALDPVWSVIHFTGTPVDGRFAYRSSAFRYIWVSDPGAALEAEYEYLPLARRGEFSCTDALVNRVWETAAYTFHLNCREFFLDGIKRDHWVWCADAYQCLFVNRYLFFDPDIEQRTLIALAGKKPFVKHINTIVDYTFFWFIALYEHYRTYGDMDFLTRIAPQMEEIMRYCLRCEDSDGFVRGQEGDWVFIDWADMDKTGALCGEQILWAKALECYARLREVLDQPVPAMEAKIKGLQGRIIEKFYDPAAGAFIDSYESGRQNITRHSNILAYLFLSCDEAVKAEIYKNVILNDAVPPITTPYFKFYENQVHCMAGNSVMLEESIRGYYGGMLRLGATTFYEEFDPKKSGCEHLSMYGRPYEKSLCHAWSASPIYLLGAYRLGVRNTGVAYSTFDVRPQVGGLKAISGKVPVPGGAVSVSVNEREIRVLSDIAGGTLWVADRSYPLNAGEEFVLHRE